MSPPRQQPLQIKQDLVRYLLEGLASENFSDIIIINVPKIANDQVVYNLRAKLAIQSKPNTSSNTQNSMAFYKQEILAISTFAFVILILIFQLILMTLVCTSKKINFKRKPQHTEPAV